MTPKRPLRFGLIADPQYADHDAQNGRDFRASLGKLAEAVEVLNTADLDFVVTLGDLIDRDWDSFGPALSAYRALRPPHHFVLGNHDFAVAPARCADVAVRMGRDTRYTTFPVAHARVVILDQTEVSIFATPPGSPARAEADALMQALRAEGAPNAFDWNAGLSDAQLTWLEGELQAADKDGVRVLVFGHYPVEPFGTHCLWNASALREILASHDSAVLYSAGHDHKGGYAEFGGTHFLTLEGMVETSDTNAFAIAEISESEIKIEGFGRATSRRLTLG